MNNKLRLFLAAFIVILASLLWAFILKGDVTVQKMVEEKDNTTLTDKPSALKISQEKSEHEVFVLVNNNKVLSYKFSSAPGQESSSIPQGYSIWGDYLFVPERNTILRYNLKTGEKKQVFEYTQQENTRGDLSITDIEIVGDKLVVVLDAYMSRSKVFYFSLPDGEVKELPNTLSTNRIEIIQGKHYLVGGFGDGCGGLNTYSLLNTTTLSSKKVVDSAKGCNDGDEIIDNLPGEFLLSKHTREGESDPMDQYYRDLTTVSLTNPSQQRVLIVPNEMPANIYIVKYSAMDNSVILVGDDIYSFSLKTRKLSLLSKIPDVFPLRSVVNWDEKSVCVQAGRVEANKTYRQHFYKIARSDGSFLEVLNCEKEDTHSNKYIQKQNFEKQVQELKEYVHSLRLPSTVRVTIDGLSYF